MIATRTRYLVAMGLLPAGLFAAACRPSSTITTPPSDDGGHGATVNAPSSSEAGAGVVRPPPPVPPPPRTVTREDAGDGVWTVTVQRDVANEPLRQHPMPSCPSGQFCFANPARASQNVASQLGRDAGAAPPFAECPAQVRSPSAPQGTFAAELTKTERATAPEACCYGWYLPCPGGRPLREGERVFVADAVSRDDWSCSERSSFELVGDGTTHARLTAHWLEQAAAEHASVASFNRFAMQLLALGAPPEMLTASLDAARDEIRHAEICYGFAARYAGTAFGPGKLALPPGETPIDPVSVALETLRDGCLGESLAAEIAGEASRRAREPEIARALARIAEDEARHAELAWRSVAWLVAEHGAPVRAAIAAFAAELVAARAEALVSLADADLAEHGVLAEVDQAACREAVVRDVVLPCLDALTACRVAA